MKWLKLFLVLELFALGLYTIFVIQNQGWNLIPHFAGALKDMSWQGQFNLDFLILLTLSGIWVSWRHAHNTVGLCLGFLTAIGGTMVLFPYLLLEISRCKGDVGALLMGRQRAARTNLPF